MLPFITSARIGSPAVTLRGSAGRRNDAQEAVVLRPVVIRDTPAWGRNHRRRMARAVVRCVIHCWHRAQYAGAGSKARRRRALPGQSQYERGRVVKRAGGACSQRMQTRPHLHPHPLEVGSPGAGWRVLSFASSGLRYIVGSGHSTLSQMVKRTGGMLTQDACRRWRIAMDRSGDQMRVTVGSVR